MAHSLLHACQFTGVVVAMGGAVLMLFFVIPALQRFKPPGPELVHGLAESVERWVYRGAWFGAVAGVLSVFVDVAEINGQSFVGLDLTKAGRFVVVTTVGSLSFLGILALLLIGVAIRFAGRWKWGLTGAGALAAALCTSLVSHAAAQPSGRFAALTIQFIHILGASVWLGVLFHLVLARGAIERGTEDASIGLMSEIVRRFSPVAMSAVGLLAISGLIMAVRYLGAFAAVPTSAYGLTLVVKLLLLAPLFFAGFINYKYIRPGLESAQANGSVQFRHELLGRFGRALELEVTAGVLVITVAGVLASVSPPAGLDTLRLTPAQIEALSRAHLPQTQIENPETFYGAQERSLADMNYSEFTHNWSGIMVFLLGACWLVQSLGGRAGRWVERLWPALLIPFPMFIAVAADPEVWLLDKVSLRQTIQDPQLLEHQLGALLAFCLVGLGWLDWRLPEQKRPLGYVLPVVMILGSLLLLGHAHANFTATQELTNLINVQHAIFGTFGLFAGTVRWLQLRGLVPSGPARILWPSLVMGLGLFMIFFYRETVS